MISLEVVGIGKKYGDLEALKDISFTLTPGIYGLLGPNGAGKSTLIHILIQSLKPDAGQLFWNGKSVLEHKDDYLSILGYVPQQQALYPEFTVWQYLDYMSALKGIAPDEAEKRMEQVLREVELEENKKDLIRTLSGGMKQRLLIAQSLLNLPQFLVMDEPTAGLDPRQRILIKNLLVKLSKDRIILLATHIVSDLEAIADEILLLRKGVFLKKEKPEILSGEIENHFFTSAENSAVMSDLEKVYMYYFEYEKANIL